MSTKKCFGFSKKGNLRQKQKNPIIIALDDKNWEQILPIINSLQTTGCIFKVTDLLFEEGIKNLLPKLSAYGFVMADLKCHDIPNTVANTCRRLRACPPWAVTVHGSGGKEMIKAACKELDGTHTKVLVVTVLTSIDSQTCEEIYCRQPLEQVLKLAKIAKDAGAHGLVCSPEEVSELRSKFPKFTLVTPGIRSPGKDHQDQKRISTPRAAINSGADYLVMGRQILNAEDPVEEVRRILKDEISIFLT